MERMSSRANVLVWGLGFLLIPWMSGGSTPLGIFIDLAVLAVMAALLANDGARLPRPSGAGWWYLALVGWTGLSLLWSVNRFQSVMWLILLVIAGAAYIATGILAQTQALRQKIILVYLIAAGITAGWGLVLYLSDPYERLTGPFYLANPAAAFLLPALMLAVEQAVRTRSRWMTALAGLIGGAVILTDSRTIFLTGIAAFVAVCVVYPRQFRRASKRLGIIAGVAIAIVLLSDTIRTNALHYTGTSQPGGRFAEIAEGRSTSGSDRIYFLRSALSIWKEHPVLGTGAGTFPTEHPRYQIRVISASAHVHNLYAEVLADLGIVGFIIILGAVCAVFYPMLAVIRSRTSFVLSLAILVILVHFAVDIEASFPAVVVALAVLLGLTFPLGQRSESGRTSGLIWVLPIVLVVLAGLTYSQVRARSHHELARYYSADGDVAAAEGEESLSIDKVFYDPDYVTQEGIYLYSTLSVMNEKQRAAALQACLAYAHQAQVADPDDSQHYQFEGRVLALARDKSGAEKAFKRALELDSYNHPDYASDLVGLYQSEGKTGKALKTAHAMLGQYTATVISNRSNDPALRSNLANLEATMGSIYLQQGNKGAAAQAAAAGLKIDPKNLRCLALSHQLAAEPS